MGEPSYAGVVRPVAGVRYPVPRGGATLFSASAVAVAAYCGTPAAGFLLIAENYRRLGERRFVGAVLVLGIAATWLEAVCVLFLPFAAWLPLCIGLLVATRLFAARAQGAFVAQHVSRGGRLGSRWVAFGAGMACLGAVLAAWLILTYFETTFR
jgi:hypothetical protein